MLVCSANLAAAVCCVSSVHLLVAPLPRAVATFRPLHRDMLQCRKSQFERLFADCFRLYKYFAHASRADCLKDSDVPLVWTSFSDKNVLCRSGRDTSGLTKKQFMAAADEEFLSCIARIDATLTSVTEGTPASSVPSLAARPASEPSGPAPPRANSPTCNGSKQGVGASQHHSPAAPPAAKLPVAARCAHASTNQRGDGVLPRKSQVGTAKTKRVIRKSYRLSQLSPVSPM